MGVVHANIRFTVTASVVLAGLILSIISGLFGGLLPARAAARLEIVEALRHL
jgi:ABC-type antimicrobial peptide transport system permease subunit